MHLTYVNYLVAIIYKTCNEIHPTTTIYPLCFHEEIRKECEADFSVMNKTTNGHFDGLPDAQKMERQQNTHQESKW